MGKAGHYMCVYCFLSHNVSIYADRIMAKVLWSKNPFSVIGSKQDVEETNMFSF